MARENKVTTISQFKQFQTAPGRLVHLVSGIVLSEIFENFGIDIERKPVEDEKTSSLSSDRNSEGRVEALGD